MPHSTVRVDDNQFLAAFRHHFPTARLKEALKKAGLRTRERVLPLWVLPGLLVAWFWMPKDRLPWVLRFLQPRQSKTSLPCDAAVYQARLRLGWAPVRGLRKRVLGALADAQQDPTAFYHQRRLLGIDGTTLTVADTPQNERTFGKAKNQHRKSGYPLIRVVGLCELGTRALVDWVARGQHRSENRLARRLLPRVPAGSLLLMDRNFHGYQLWQAAKNQGFDLLIRVQSGPTFPVEKALDDGSYLSRVYPKGKKSTEKGIVVRVIHYCWKDETGRVHESRVLTSMPDASSEPAAELVRLYHERWEQELAFREVKEQLAPRQTHIRAEDPVRAMAELDGMLMGHWVMRWVMLQAARQAKVPPVQLSFVGVLRVLRLRLSQSSVGAGGWSAWWQEVLPELGQQRVQKRRNRQCPRVRKTTRSHWPVKKKQHQETTLPTIEVIPIRKP